MVGSQSQLQLPRYVHHSPRTLSIWYSALCWSSRLSTFNFSVEHGGVVTAHAAAASMYVYVQGVYIWRSRSAKLQALACVQCVVWSGKSKKSGSGFRVWKIVTPGRVRANPEKPVARKNPDSKLSGPAPGFRVFSRFKFFKICLRNNKYQLKINQ
jgi:hypothetical protein